jgi:tRNA A37 threonylcarbamoyltransferase TsaD
MMHDYKKVYGDSEFLFAGGVMCNSLVRSVVSKEGICYFADPALSADNAVGVAALALRKYTMGK